MARGKGLTALKIKSLKEPGRYSDGDGLALVIGRDGSRKWVLRLQHNGKRSDIGLGAEGRVSLQQARDEVVKIRAMIRDGLDPLEERRKAKHQQDIIPTFADAARTLHKEHAPAWRNAKHAAQWLSSLETYAFPQIGAMRIDRIEGPRVRDLLAEIWLTKPETARRVKQRVGTVLDWAHAKGYRPAEAPMRAIAKGLPKQPRKDEHFTALPWQEVPPFIEALKASNAGEVVKLAFEFLILTAARSGEVRGATWQEVDLERELWTVPAERMKAGKSHAVPLSKRATAVLQRAKELETGKTDLIFPGARLDRPISDMTLTMLLRRMKVNATAHGFRSSFRDWTAEATNFVRDVAEAALAHAVESRVEAAYRRSDLLEKRRKMMEAWAGFCSGGTGKVVPMTRKKA